MGGNNLADVQRLTIVADPSNANGSALGGIRMGNAVFGSASGVVGIAATNVAVQDVVTIGDINATGSAIPTLNFGANSQFGTVNIAGGDLVNSKTISNSGYKYDVSLNAGTTSGGTTLAASTNYAGLAFTQTPASVAAAIVPAIVNQTFTLGSGTDTPTGGAGNDIFDGSLNSSGAQTLNSTDRLDGSTGADSLSATINSSVTPASLANIETITLTATANTPTVDLVNAGQVTTLNSQATTSALTVSNIVSPAVALSVADSSSNHTFNFKASSVTGAADAVALTLSNVTGGTVTIPSVETLTLTSNSSPNTVEVAGAALGTINVGGSANATVTLEAATLSVSALNASTATGNVNLTLTNQTGILTTTAVTVSGGAGADSIDVTAHTQSDLSIRGGAGNDTITFGANLQATDSIDGGEGTDTLVVTNGAANANDATTPTTYRFTNIEGITLTDALDGTLALPNLATTLNTVNLTLAGANGATLAVGGDTITGPAGTLTLNIGASAAGNTTALGGALTVGDTGTATNDALILNNTSVNSTTGLSVNVFNGQNLTASGYENVTIDVGSRNYTSPAQTIGTLAINPDTGGVASLTLRGTNDVSVTSITTTATGLLTIDASGINASLDTSYLVIGGTSQGTGGTANITGTSGRDEITVGNFSSTIIGGGGNDLLTGGTQSDYIDGGAGNDTLIGSGRSDTIIGGDGVDTITVTAVVSATNAVSIDAGAGNDLITSSGALSADDTINGGDGTDTLVLSNTDATTVNALSIASVNTLNNNISGIEIVRFDNGLAQNIDVGRLDGISNLELGSLNTGAVTISGLAASNSIRLTAALNQTLALSLADSTGSADVVNATIAGSGNVLVGTVNVAGIETVAITATDTDTGIANAAHTITVTDTGVTAADKKLTAVTISGNAASLDLTLTGSSLVSTVNASSFSGGLTATAVSSVAVTMNGGAGADSLVGAGGADSISGNSGDDVIDGGLGADTLSGGLGTNTLETSAGLNIGATTDTNGNVAIAGVVVNLGATALSAAAVNTATSSFIAGSLASIPSGSSAYLFGTNTNLASPNVDTISGFTRVVGTSGADYLVGGSSAETLSGGAGADTINGGAGADSLTGGAGADALDGGTGTDVVSYSDVSEATSHGLAHLAGVAINLSGSDVTAATIATAMGGTIVIGGGNGAAGSDLVAGTAGYLAAAQGNSTTTMVRDTITAVENVVGSSLRDYIVDGEGSNTITGRAGGDVIVLTVEATSAADTIVVAGGDTVVAIGGAGNAGTITGFDVVSGLNASATGVKDILDVAGTAALATATAGSDGTDSTLTIGNVAVKSHAIDANGFISFDDADTYAGALTLGNDAALAAVVQYLLANDIGSAGSTVVFTINGADSYVYTQAGAGAGSVDGYTLVKVVGVVATGVETASSATANRIRIG